MNPLIFLVLLGICLSAQSQMSKDAERARISNERSVLEAGFSREEAACYPQFLVNGCLDEVQVRRRGALADLRRQEIVLNDQERKANGAEQIKKTEDKDLPKKQQQAVDKRAEALKDFDDRMAREQQKNDARASAETNVKSKLDAAAMRDKKTQDKQTIRAAKQVTAAEEVKKYDQRLEKARERQARIAKEKASQVKQPANPLPVPK